MAGGERVSLARYMSLAVSRVKRLRNEAIYRGKINEGSAATRRQQRRV